MPASRTTRRGLLAAAAAATATASATYAARTPEALATDPPPKSDPELLRELLAIEQLLIVVYRRVIASGLLSARVDRVARRVEQQEQAHARAIARRLQTVGGSAPRPLHTTDAIDKALHDLKVSGRVSGLRNEHDCVHLLLDLEMGAEGAYYQAISQFTSLSLTQLAVGILANEAQHQTAVSEARRPGDASQAVPTSFVKGKSP
jgi:ferritin-like protein